MIPIPNIKKIKNKNSLNNKASEMHNTIGKINIKNIIGKKKITKTIFLRKQLSK